MRATIELINRMRNMAQCPGYDGKIKVLSCELRAMCDEIERLQRQKDIELEDHLAGLAMQTLLEQMLIGDYKNALKKEVSQAAYKMAENMMEVRKLRMERD